MSPSSPGTARSILRRGFTLIAVSAAALAATPVLASAATTACGAPVASGGESTVTCAYIGSLQSFTVPAGVGSVTLTVDGGVGGASPFLGETPNGGESVGTLVVNSGEVLTVMTGGQGGASVGTAGGAGGYGGGGHGSTGSSDGGSGGGGGSFVWDQGGALVIAAGGGGGEASEGSPSDSCAGVGGGASGGNGGLNCAGGTGGTQTAGGCGGYQDVCAGSGNGTGHAVWDAGSPTPGTGGIGGAPQSQDPYFGGGGGGGGYFGGGGGVGGFYASGGGGSGFISSTLLTAAATTADVNDGNGVVVITYLTPQAPTFASSDAATVPTATLSTIPISASGQPAVSNITCASTCPLPGGMSFQDNGDGTATISGVASTPGTYPVTLDASNGLSPDAQQTLTITVTAPPTLTADTSTTFYEGAPGTFSFNATGTPTPAFGITGKLPAGVTFVDDGDGTATLAGTPTREGVYPLSISARNGVSPDATESFKLQVDGPPTIIKTPQPIFVANRHGSFTFAASGTPTPTFSSGAGSFPAGVTIAESTHGTATISGIPKHGGIFLKTLVLKNNVTQPEKIPVQVVVLSLGKAAPAKLTAGDKATVRLTGTGFEKALKPKLKSSSTSVKISGVKVVSATTITAQLKVGRQARRTAIKLTLTEGGKSVAATVTVVK